MNKPTPVCQPGTPYTPLLTMRKIETSFFPALLTVVMTAFGIAMLIHYCPTPAFDPLALVRTHRMPIGFSLLAAVLIGWLATRDALRASMLGLGGMFLLSGVFFCMNGALDTSPPEDHFFAIVRKGREYRDNATNPGAFSYFFDGIDGATGQIFKFSTYATHITKAQYDSVDLARSPAWVHVTVRRGFLRVPWRRIQGVVFEHPADRR